MLRFLNNHDDNFYKTQYNETSLANSDEHEGRKKELIILKLLKSIFESTIRKMELAVALPSLILDPELSTILTNDEVNVINDIFLYDTEQCSACLVESAFEYSSCRYATTKTNCQTTRNVNKFEHAVYRALKILSKHIDVLHPCDKYISMPSVLFLRHLRYFLEHALYKLHLTPKRARSKELHYRKLWRDQEKSIKDIDTFTRDLEKQRSNHKKILENVVKQYKTNIAVVDEINKKCNEDIANTTVKYEKKQLILYKVWEVEQNEVQLALNNIVDDLESLKNINANVEEATYNRRLTIESKLLAILTKYDTEIGSRYQTLEELNQIYEDNKLEKLALEQEINEQEEVYNALLGNTDFYERLATLQQERSAKSIQRWWRKIMSGKPAKSQLEEKEEEEGIE